MKVSRRRIHPQGPEFSRLVWGAWRALKSPETDHPASLAKVIEGCLELGVTAFDHADVYGGYSVEALFGAAMKEWRGDRTHIEIITKCDICAPGPARPETRVKHYNTSASHIRASVDRSLANFGTDYIDLLLIHRPDPFMDADSAARGLEDVVASGKVRFAGVSNHSPSQFSLLQSRLPFPLVTNQIEFSLLHTAPLFDGLLDQAQELRASPMVWSPLGGGGLFTSKDVHADRLRGALATIGGRVGCDDPAALAFAWLLAHPSHPFPIIGSTKMQRVREAVAAEAVRLDRQDWFALLEAARGFAVP